MGILLVEGDSYFLRTCIPVGKRTIRVCCSPLAAPNASFIHIQRRFRIVREHRLVVRAFDGDGDGLFRPGPPVVHDADHKGLGHALALAQCRDVIIALVELIGIVPVLVQGQGPVLRGGDVPAVTTPGDIHRAGPPIMAAAVLPHRGGGQRRIIARALQGELQSVVVSVRGFLPRAVFPVVIRGLHTAGEPDHGIGHTIGRAVGMQAVVRHRYFLAGGIEELFAVKDVQRRPVIGAGHRDRHFLAGPGAMLVPDEDGEGLRQRLAFIEVVEPVVLRPVTGRKIAALVQRVGIAAVRSDGQAAVLPPDGDIAAVSGKVDAIRGFGLAGLHTVDEFRAVVGILARGLVAVRERTVIPADLVSSRPVLAGRVNELVIRPIDHGTVIMTAHAAFRDVQRAVIRSVTQLQTGLVVGPVDGDGDVGGNFLAEGIPDRDGKGLGQHLALGQLVDGIAVRIKSAGLELIGIGTVCMEGQRTVAGFIDGIAVRRSGDQLGRLRLGHGRRTVRFQLGIRGIHTEGEIPLVAKVNVRGIDPARKALCLVMAGDDIALPVDDIPRLCRRIAVTAVMVDAFFLEDEIILVRDDRERARAFHLDDDLPGVVSTMLIHHGDLKGLEMGVFGIELLDELAPAVDHIGPAAVRIDGQSTVVGRENGLGAAFRADMPRLRLMPCGRRGRMLHISIRMGTAGNTDGLVTARIGIDVPDIERSGKLGPARGVIGISGVALYGLEHRTVREDLSVAIPDLQRRLVIAARNGDGHGLQIPGAVLVLHIDGEGIRDGGPFRQGIDGGDVEGLAVKAGRPLHGFSLALQGIGPGAVAVQDQMAEAPFHGLAALHVAIRGILAQKDVCVRALRPFPAAVLALVTGHGTEPQLVPGVHVRAGHLAFQLLRALVIGVRAVVGLVLFLRTRSSHHLTVIGTPHAALDEPQLGIRIQRDLRLVVGPLDGHGERGLGLTALPVLHAHGEVLTHGLAQGQAVGIGVIVVQGIGDDTGVGIDGDDAILGDDAVAAVGKAVGQPPAVRIAGHHLPHDDRHTGGEDIALDLLAPVGLHTGFHQGHVVTVHSDDAADLGIEVLVRPAADLIVGPLHAIAKTDVQTPQMIDAVQQVAAAVFVIAAAARGAAAGGRTGGGHQVFAKGREEILPAALHPFHLEGGHIFLGIRGVEALQPDGRPIFKAQDKIVAIAGQRRRIRRKIEDEAPVRSAGDGLCGTSNRLGKTDIGHEGPPDKKSCDLSKKYENVKSPVPKGLGTGLGFARHARGASGVRQGEGIKKSCHAR